RQCDESSGLCVESTVTCEGIAWTAPMMASVPAGALPDLFTDTWFVREGSGEREVSTATCGAMTCQAVDLPALNWGNCIELADAHDEFVSGDEISKYFSRVVPPESGEGSGSTSSGISASYTCQ